MGVLIYFATFLGRGQSHQTEALREQGLFKSERLITGPQQADIDVRMNGGSKHVLKPTTTWASPTIPM
jgi:hypothetical protein